MTTQPVAQIRFHIDGVSPRISTRANHQHEFGVGLAMPEAESDSSIRVTARRLIVAMTILVLFVHLASWGFYEILDGDVPYFECLYRATLLITTVNEPLAFEVPAPQARLLDQYTMVVLLTGMGLVLYTVSTFAAWIIEGDLRGGVRRRRVRRMINRHHDHIIVCGGGRTGEMMMSELKKLGQSCVVIESDLDRVEALDRAGFMVLRGDATQDLVLEQAGIERARGIITALPGDKENLFVVVTARQYSSKLQIVSRAVDPHTDRKLMQAGANFVVGAKEIAANRMVSTLVRPHVVTFIDRLMRDPESTNRIEEVLIAPNSSLDGVTLGDSRIGATTGLLVIALQDSESSQFICNPGASAELTAHTRLVVLGDIAKLSALRKMAATRR